MYYAWVQLSGTRGFSGYVRILDKCRCAAPRLQKLDFPRSFYYLRDHKINGRKDK